HPEPGIARERFEPVTITFWVKPSDVTRRSILMHNSKAYWGAAGRGIECFLDHGRVEFGLRHFLPGNAVRVVSREKLPVGEWTHVAVTYDGSSRADGFRIAFNANEGPTDPLRDNLYGTILWPQDELPLVIGQRDGEVGFRGGVVDEFMVFGKALTRLEIAHLAQGLRAANNLVVDKSGVPEEHYLQRISEKYRVARERIRQARQAEHEFVESLTPIMVMRDKGAPAKAHVLVRGVYNQPGEEVGPGVPAAILPPRSDQPRNRLELARWLLRRDHPLTARVAVNRIWKMFFGRGLVATQEDFGSQGTAPSHPELLDDLAARFYESGWDMKSLCKRIVMSATYRQDSEIRSAAHAKDPANELLWRGPRYRYDAEQIRDVALASCGILTSRIGGPSVKPYQPAGLWKEVGPATFEASSGESLYRRSMYTFWKRTSPPPAMLSFDAVSREVCVARREATLTPNQALVLLNDPQFVDPARVLAATLVSQYGSDARSALTESFARLICRYPTDAEVDELCQAHAEQLDLFSSDEQAARDFIGIGEWPQGAALPPCEVAAMTSAIQLIMNFHEFQMKL
ncbi:MAG: DUF1553 domain-containing protein, partial [Pirellulales bacterium]|nr:DUF1553 domain-containing protein [Pirellulales bacterium]